LCVTVFVLVVSIALLCRYAKLLSFDAPGKSTAALQPTVSDLAMENILIRVSRKGRFDTAMACPVVTHAAEVKTPTRQSRNAHAIDEFIGWYC
jgi:hypothetical protein